MLRLIQIAKLRIYVKCCRKWIHVISDKGEHIFHASYLGLVAYEAHGHYRYAAMGVLACIVLHAIAGEIDE